ncbi:hypothetical protein [Endozoicomonas euniceicola]|uniref:DUF4435 domain-containing protein n=1 Tax=Endozoicomonas euniceicola TaxID=1234143 RepID=A0ABY6GWZ6_9GAMM|nr:hypothetical protein [Endozoicomonas euniceicola]UYM17303.1 hypothetical protein NX720_05100 [Endozoicomonas euniceicola]
MNGTPTTVNSSIHCLTGDHREQQEKLPEITTSTTSQGTLADAARVLPVNNELLPELALSPPSKNIQFGRRVRCLPDTNSEKISQCTAAIKEAFPLLTTDLTKENKANNTSHFFYSNDYSGGYYESLNFPAMIADMAKRPETQSKSPRIGLVIGQSSLPDAAPEFARHCDIVLIVDNDPLLLSSIEKRMDLLTGCESEEYYYKKLHSYIFFDLLNLRRGKISYNDNLLKENINIELENTRKALGRHWTFSSQKRLTEVKEAVKKTHFIPVYGNIFSREFLKSMGNILTHHDAVVHALNLTNVFEYHPKIKERRTPYDTENTIEKPSELADILKFSPKAFIHSSRILRSDKGSRFDPPADHFQALDDSF